MRYPLPVGGRPHVWFALGVFGVPAAWTAISFVPGLRDLGGPVFVVGIAAFCYCAWRATETREMDRYERWAESNPDGDRLARLAYPEQLAQHYGGTLPPEVCEHLVLTLAVGWQPEGVQRLLAKAARGKVLTCADVDQVVEYMVARDGPEVEASIRKVPKWAREMARARRSGVAWTERIEVAVSADQLCPFCQDALRSEDDAVSCGACRTVLHRECFGELGGCPSIGCRNQPRRRA